MIQLITNSPFSLSLKGGEIIYYIYMSSPSNEILEAKEARTHIANERLC